MGGVCIGGKRYNYKENNMDEMNCGEYWVGNTRVELIAQPCRFKGDKIVGYGVYKHVPHMMTMPDG